MLPKKREDKLVVEELSDETLVYDLISHKAHCLNELASVIWKHCDGKTSPRDLASAASRALATSTSRKVVTATLAQLEHANLLRATGADRSARRITRRELAREMAAAGIAAAVVTITSPHAAQAATGLICCDAGGPCPVGQNCVARPICAPCTLTGKCCQPP